jgi:hypothetical protein
MMLYRDEWKTRLNVLYVGELSSCLSTPLSRSRVLQLGIDVTQYAVSVYLICIAQQEYDPSSKT